ncbi:MAG TPA: hypothetical protein PK339_06180 [Flavitalea sp.]|nr:hypothetical protein [Flavitalea sp.]
MKIIRNIWFASFFLAIVSTGSSCKVWNSVFGPKYGCPADGKAFGAEKILSGEKPPKAKKFRS